MGTVKGARIGQTVIRRLRLSRNLLRSSRASAEMGDTD
jgi:hypothetical protein